MGMTQRKINRRKPLLHIPKHKIITQRNKKPRSIKTLMLQAMGITEI